MVKVVINNCHGGFGLSNEGLARYNELRVEAGKEPTKFSLDIQRTSPELIQVVEEMGDKSHARCSELEVMEIDDIFADTYKIREYDGAEWIECYISDVIRDLVPSHQEIDDMSPEQMCCMLITMATLLEKYPQDETSQFD